MDDRMGEIASYYNAQSAAVRARRHILLLSVEPAPE